MTTTPSNDSKPDPPPSPPPKESDSSGLFRQSALKNISAGEHIDQMLQVVRPSYWIILSVIFFLLAIFIVWLFLGRVPKVVEGQGMILPKDGVYQITSPAGGLLKSEPLAEGKIVKQGDFIARILTSESIQALKNARDDEKLAEINYRDQQAIYVATMAASKTADTTVLKLMRENISSIEKDLVDQKKEYEITGQLFKDGYVTRSDLLAAESAVSATDQSLHDSRMSLSDRLVSDQENRIQKEELLRQARQSFDKAVDQRKQVEAENITAEIYSPIGGVIQEFVLKRNDSVNTGGEICLIESEGPPEVASIFFPTDNAARIKPGEIVKMEVSSYPPDRFGKLLGRVTRVDKLPASQSVIKAGCGYSSNLANELIAGPPVNRVDVVLETEMKGNRRVYRRTGGGEAFSVSSGMIVSGSAVIEEQVPITMVIPALKKWFGLSEI